MQRAPVLPDPAALASSVCAGERSAVAAALNLLDDRRAAARAIATSFLAQLPRARLETAGHLIGITGPPGVGKSSLSSALIAVWRARGLTVGVLAVDPSSPVSGGALLGDRLRMLAGQADASVFVRSLACRGEMGGLSAEAWPMSLAMLAAFDIVLVETVGVGQKEIDVSKMTDTTCYVAQPASGDSIQFLKAGIMEVPHVLVVNKADLGALAQRTLAELEASLRRSEADAGWSVPALAVSAAQASGIDALADTLRDHRSWLEQHGLLSARRRQFQAQWIHKRLREEFGRHGIDLLGGETHLLEELAQDEAPAFEQFDALRERLLTHWKS